MVKYIGIALLSILMTSCTLFAEPDKETEVEYITVKEPVVVVPAPPTLPDIRYELSTLSEKEMQDDGIYAKALVITIMQLNDYSEVLELIIYKYREMAEESSTKIEQEEKSSVSELRAGAAAPLNSEKVQKPASEMDMSRIRRNLRHEFDLEMLQEKLNDLYEKEYNVKNPSSLREDL